MGKTTTLADIVSSNGSLIVPTGGTASRPSANAGSIRFNTDLGTLESANGTAWANVGSGSASSGGGGVSWQTVQNTNFIAVTGNGYVVNTQIANVTVTLPASPTAGQILQFVDYSGTFSSNNLIIYPNGLKIAGNASNVIVNTNGASIGLTYIDTNRGWIPYSGFSASPIGTYSIDFLLIAGGGGGGSDVGGGGGAGGLINGSGIIVNPGSSYSFTVGAAGAGTTSSNGTPGGSGSNSVGFGQTAIGGGGGGSWPGTAATSGGSGGGGGAGGGGGNAPAGTGGSGTAGQGYAGGNGGTGTSYDGYGLGGGGGGAGGLGAGNNSASGGIGLQFSSWATATSTGGGGYYAGGGGGNSNGNTYAGPGGAGGGANGNNNASPGTGGGGGGGGAPNNGGNGGSGILLIRYVSAYQRGVGGTVSSANGYTYHAFTSSGTFTA